MFWDVLWRNETVLIGLLNWEQSLEIRHDLLQWLQRLYFELGCWVFVTVWRLFLLLHHWECGKSSAESVLDKLAPCDAAAQDKNAKVSRKCYNEVKIFGKHRLCAIILSTEAESLGIKPEAAMSTIPKRCKFSKRPMGGPVGYKRGGIVLFFKI